jgi:hypothetical protein
MSTKKCPDGMTWREFAAEEADPEPHPGEPPCGHDECDTVWQEDNCMEDRPEDWGAGSCIEVYRWEVDAARGEWNWKPHPDHPDGFEGTPDEGRRFLKTVSGRARMWLTVDLGPLQRESDEDLLFCKREG